MEALLQKFEKPYVDGSGERYTVELHGQARPGDTWVGWLVFDRTSDGARLATGPETTQPSSEAVLYWATGLGDVYLDGALQRANSGAAAPLGEIERAILQFFADHAAAQVDARELFAGVPFPSADVVRGLEDLEKHHGLVQRRTEGGTEWVVLTAVTA